MNSSLILSFNSAVAKYSRLTKKVRKSISKGEFWRYTRRKRHHLLARIERLRRRIMELRMQAKLAGVGIAAGLLLMSAREASAQQPTSLGPFVANRAANPFPPPAFNPVNTPFVTFLDIDVDGDLDAAITEAYGSQSPYYYMNTGDKEHPFFESIYLGGITWYPGAEKARIAFADVDDDGDLDAVVGMDRTSGYDYSLGTDSLYFFRNTAGPSTFPDFQVDHTGTNPFSGIRLKRQGWPAFTDYDNDGDLDLVVTGEYDDESTGKTAWLQFLRNDKEGHDSGVDVTYTPLQTPANNPLYLGENPTVGFYGISFADLDGDGDDDAFAIDQHGQMTYRRNDGNGVFTLQVGNYVYKPNGASTGNPLQISGVMITTADSYQCLSFGDLDGDGDTDLVIGNNSVGTLNSQYIYVENTGNGVMVPDNSHSNPISGFTIGYGNGRFFDYDKDGDNDFIATGHITVPDGVEGSTKDVVGHAFFKNDAGNFDLQEDVNDAFDALSVDGTQGNWQTADVDGDGDRDALYIHTEYDATAMTYFLAIEYYRNDNGTFAIQAAPDNAFAPIMTMPYFGSLLDIGDLNSDGLPDIVLFGNGDLPKFFRNTGQIGDASFVEEPAWQDGLVTTEVLAPKLVDIDGDGDTDMVLGKYFYIWYYENIGTPTAPKWVEYQDSSPNNPFESVSLGGSGGIWPEVADIDGDGDKDFLPGKDGIFGYYRNDNPAPVITSGENKNIPLLINQAVDLDPVATITDSDGDKIVKTTITITPYDQGQEKLQVPAASSYPNLTISWDDQRGQLTINGSSTVADHQDALQDVQYLYTGPSSSGRIASSGARTIAKTITVTILDADLTIGSSNTTTYAVSHTNIAPVLTPSSFNATFTSAAVPVLPSIVLSDADDVTLASAQVSFDVSSYKAAEDRLQVTLTSGISASFDQATGILTLTGVGTVSDYQAALQAVQYNNASGTTATAGTRTLTVKVNDGEVDSNVGTTQLTVNSAVPPTNTPPTISGISSQFYTTGDLLINNNIVVADVDGVLTGATVAIGSGFTPSEDVLVFVDQNGITGNYSNSTGVLTLTGSSSVANYQAALRSVKYRNTSTDPNTADRAITFTITDGNPAVSLAGTVITINKPPVIKTVTKKQAASDGNVGFPVSALSDPDGNLDLTTLKVTSEKGNVIVADGIITVDYSARGNTKDIDHITITVCDTGGRCKTQDIEVELGAAAIIYTGMSPNGDGVNDWFYIENLPLHTHVSVYDRWGDAIFQTGEYDMTEPSQRFEGKNKNGADVVAGSYFYKVKFTDSNTVKTGYIILNR